MALSTYSVSGAAGPVPPRFWWTKRIAIAVVVAAVAMVLVNMWWAHVADRRIQSVIDGARARGEPILPEDFDAAPVPDADNKAVLLQKAVNAITTTPAFAGFLRNHDVDEPLNGQDLEVLKENLAGNANALRLARRARTAGGVNWQVPVRRPMLSSPAFNHLDSQRDLMKLLYWSALYNHENKNDREAIEAIRDILNQADAVGRGPSTLVVELVCIGLDAQAIDAIERITPTLEITPGSTSTNPTTQSIAATRKQIFELIATLSDDAEFQRRAVRGWYGERALELDTFRSFIDNNNKGYVKGAMRGVGVPAPFRAAMELDAMRSVAMSEAGEQAVRQSDLPAAWTKLHSIDYDQSGLESAATLLSHILTPAVGRSVEQYFRENVSRRAAVLALAIRPYRLDHAGAYPASLSELVPTYLPGVPVDPYSAYGRPMSYRRTPAPPAVYSVGLNGTDDGGTSLPYEIPGAGGGWRTRWECDDIVFPLEYVAPVTQPSAKTENNQ